MRRRPLLQQFVGLVMCVGAQYCYTTVSFSFKHVIVGVIGREIRPRHYYVLNYSQVVAKEDGTI